MKLNKLIEECLLIGNKISDKKDAGFMLFLVRRGSKNIWVVKIEYLINIEVQGYTPQKAVENLLMELKNYEPN